LTLALLLLLLLNLDAQKIYTVPPTSNGRAFFPVAMSIDFFGTEFVYYIIIIGQTLKDF
jgi:hypothetical protein